MAVKNVKQAKDKSIRKLTGRIDISGGTPSVGAGSGFTITDGGAGIVTINITRPGRTILGAIAIPISSTEATGHFAKVLAYTDASSVKFGIYVADGTDGALVDNVPFFFEITLKDCRV